MTPETFSQRTQIALTFEAGGDPAVCAQMLDVLRAAQAPATIFLPGSWSDQYPELVRRMAEDGHEFGNHSYSHPDLTELDDEAIRGELRRTDTLVKQLSGQRAFPWFRPPYDAVDARVQRIAQEEGYRLVQRNAVDGGHWPGESTPERVISRTLENAYDGAIIAYHLDSMKTLSALPQLLEQLADYRLLRLSELPSVSERPERRAEFANLTIDPGYLQVLQRGARAWSINVLEFGARVSCPSETPIPLAATSRWSSSLLAGREVAQPAEDADRYLLVLAGTVDCCFRTRDDPTIRVRALGRPGDFILWVQGYELQASGHADWIALVFE